MQDRFTRQALQALKLAKATAQSWKHSYIGTEHILAGLLKEKEGTAGRILEAVERQEKVWAFDWKQKKKTGRLEADLCDTGSSTGDPCDISLLGGRCQYTVPADAGCRTGRSFNRDSTTVFSGKCTDDGAIYKRRTAGNVLSNYIPSATGWSQFHQYEKNCKNR